MIIYTADICGYVIYLFSWRFVAAQYVFQNGNYFTKDTDHIMQSSDKKTLRYFSTIEVINADIIYPTKRNFVTCHAQFDQSKELSLDHGDAHGFSDNEISNGDLVQLQYIQLPYPKIRQDTIEMEYKYYLGQNTRYPVSSQYSMKLEYLNHYLYQGQNNFE